jgi:hypothetical protein
MAPSPFVEVDEVSFDRIEWKDGWLRCFYSLGGLEVCYQVKIPTITNAAAAMSGADTFGHIIGIGLLPMLFSRVAAQKLVVRPVSLDDATVELWRMWFRNALGHFFVTTGRDPEVPPMCASGGAPLRRSEIPLSESAVLMSGGGKDSIVAGEFLRKLGMPFAWFTLSPNQACKRVVDIFGAEARAYWGEEKFTWQQVGNGLRTLPAPVAPPLFPRRVPVAMLISWVTRSRYVIVANERSADIPNLEYRGLSVNHQYPKSFHFEESFSAFINETLHRDLRFVSALRPLSEVQICAMFARLTQYHRSFASCNNSWDSSTWCRRCPKCASTFLSLAPFMQRSDLVRIVGEDLLESDQLEPTYRQLAGFEGHKPLECVADTNEAVWSLSILLRRGDTSRVVGALARDIRAAVDRLGPAELAASVMTRLGSRHQLPAAWLEALDIEVGVRTSEVQ